MPEESTGVQEMEKRIIAVIDSTHIKRVPGYMHISWILKVFLLQAPEDRWPFSAAACVLLEFPVRFFPFMAILTSEFMQFPPSLSTVSMDHVFCCGSRGESCQISVSDLGSNPTI